MVRVRAGRMTTQFEAHRAIYCYALIATSIVFPAACVRAGRSRRSSRVQLVVTVWRNMTKRLQLLRSRREPPGMQARCRYHNWLLTRCCPTWMHAWMRHRVLSHKRIVSPGLAQTAALLIGMHCCPGGNELLFWHNLWVDSGWTVGTLELLLTVWAGLVQPITMLFEMFVGEKQQLYKKILLRVLLTRNSSGDEIANVNFLYNDIVHAVQNILDSCIHSATDRRGYVLEHRFTKFSEITQCNGHSTVQGHSRSPIWVPIESSHMSSY